jgi:DNA-binding CsgD family transcriptional regulator
VAKTLFFVEAFLFAALAVAFPLIASEAALAFLLPAAISLILPLSCAMAIWPASSVFRALGSAFSTKMSGTEARLSARILEELIAFSRAAAALGILLAIVAVCERAPNSGSFDTWTLLGAYLCAYALLNVALWRIMAEVVQGQAGLAAGPEMPQRPVRSETFAADYGLTPRECETAALIAEGRSYKEAAYELGITIRTVKAHMSKVYEKTGAASNVALSLLMRGGEAALDKGTMAE